MKMRYCRSCGKRNIKGRLKVCPKCAKKRIEDNGLSKANAQIVYGLYDKDGLLLYIGVTNAVTRRTAEHIDKKIFAKMSLIRKFETRREADAFEIFAIYHLRPPMNIKVLTPSVEFPESDLRIFGQVSEKNLTIGRKCLECDTILSRYNEGEHCLRHTPKPRIGGRRVDRKPGKK